MSVVEDFIDELATVTSALVDEFAAAHQREQFYAFGFNWDNVNCVVESCANTMEHLREHPDAKWDAGAWRYVTLYPTPYFDGERTHYATSTYQAFNECVAHFSPRLLEVADAGPPGSEYSTGFDQEVVRRLNRLLHRMLIDGRFNALPRASPFHLFTATEHHPDVEAAAKEFEAMRDSF